MITKYRIVEHLLSSGHKYYTVDYYEVKKYLISLFNSEGWRTVEEEEEWPCWDGVGSLGKSPIRFTYNGAVKYIESQLERPRVVTVVKTIVKEYGD